jgi:hypothetical protein
MSNTTKPQIRLKPDIAEGLRLVAERNFRTLAAEANYALAAHLAAHGCELERYPAVQQLGLGDTLRQQTEDEVEEAKRRKLLNQQMQGAVNPAVLSLFGGVGR